MIERLIEKATMRIAWWMPKRIVTWCAIRVWTHGTQGKWSSQEAPALTCSDALRRWDEA